MDSSPNTASLPAGLSLALALAIAVVGANAFADAAGFPTANTEAREPTGILLRIACAFVLFFVSWMLVRFLFQLGTRVASQLGQASQRPGLPIAITLLVCGTLCVLGALFVSWYGNSGGVTMSPGGNFPANMPGGNMVPQMELSVRATASLTRPLAVSAALVIGAVLLALGVWSSLGPGQAIAASNRALPEGGVV